MGLLSLLTVAALGVALVRWAGFRGAATPDRQAARLAIDAMAARLAGAYHAHGDWSVVPAEPGQRRRWWWAQADGAAGAGVSAYLADRAGLLDAQGRRLAGVQASPLLVALVSLDRIRHDVRVDGRTVGYLLVAQPRDADDALALAFLIRRQHQLALLAWAGLALSVIAAVVLARQVRRPVAALAAGARRLGAGEYGERIDARRRDEFGDLARAFNELASRLQMAEEARRQWVADTSHELRTPLAVLQAQLEAMRDGVRPASPDQLELPLRQTAALSRLVDDLYLLALGDVGALPLHPVPTDAGALAREVWQAFAPRLVEHGLDGAFEGTPQPLQVRADPQRLRQILVNLLENSLRYTASGGRVAMTVGATEKGWQLTLDDSAPGVPQEMLARLGERFFRVEPSRGRPGGGAGLGLALCRQWMAAHGGHLRFEPSPLGGLRVVLALPGEA